MTIKQLLNNLLNDPEIIKFLPNKKAYFLKAETPKVPYLEYEIINEFGAEYEENRESFTTYIIQIDVFSKGDYTSIEEVIKNKLLAAGFERDMAADTYEKDTKLKHKAMRFSITLKS